MFDKLVKRENRDVSNNVNSFYDSIQSVFDDFFNVGFSGLNKSDWVPAIDIVEKENAIYVKAELPGLEEKDIDIEIENNTLTIKGKKEESEKKEEKGKFYLSERSYGFFERSFSLPSNVKRDEVKAKFKNGVLKVELPFDKKEKKENKISIEVK